MNKRGFITTPILLLLIFSGAALFISVGNIKHKVDKSRDIVFIEAAQIYLKASSAWKVSDELYGYDSKCVTLETLRNGYVEDTTFYDGYVEFNINSEPLIYITNGSYMIYGKTLSDLNTLDGVDLERSDVEITIPNECK